MSDTDVRTSASDLGLSSEQLLDALRNSAHGWLPSEAAVELLIAHDYWLHRDDFRRCIDIGGDLEGPDVDDLYGEVEWSKVLDEWGHPVLAGSGSANRILMLAGSLAVGRPIDLQDAITGLDTRNLELVVKALVHCNGTKATVTVHVPRGILLEHDGGPMDGRVLDGAMYPWLAGDAPIRVNEHTFTPTGRTTERNGLPLQIWKVT